MLFGVEVRLLLKIYVAAAAKLMLTKCAKAELKLT